MPKPYANARHFAAVLAVCVGLIVFVIIAAAMAASIMEGTPA